MHDEYITSHTLDLCHCQQKGPYYRDRVPKVTFFGVLGPIWASIYISGSLFSVFWLHLREECQFSLHVYNNELSGSVFDEYWPAKNQFKVLFKTWFSRIFNSKNIQNLVFRKYSIQKLVKFFFLLKYSIQKIIHFRIYEEIQFKNIIQNWFFSWIQFKKIFHTGFFLGFNSKKYSFNTKKGVPPMAIPDWSHI